MSFQYLNKIAIAVLLCFQSTVINAFVQPVRAFGPRAPGSATPKSPLNVAASDFDFALPPGLEVKESYEQDQVPLFAVVNATMRTSQLVYQFSAMKLDIRENPDEWIDGQDMLVDGVLLEEEIADFVTKNRERVEGNPEFAAMLAYEMGLKGDNRVRCVDAKYSNEELVYAINVNRSRKQVTVAFRGTNTPKDMLVDIDIRKFECKEGDETFTIHNGFRKYLNAETAVEGDGDLTKLEQITQQLENIMATDCEGFDIFITGHSLGGALATLYGFRLAESGKFPMVTVVSYASPYVGTQSFRKVFRQLELDGKLRHVRVSNTNDSIPFNPCIGGFSHVGVNLELQGSGPVMNYEGVENPSIPVAFAGFLAGFLSILVQILSIPIGFLSIIPTIPTIFAALLSYATVKILLDAHMFPQYRKRFTTGLENCGFLSKTLEELYEKRIACIAEEGA